MTSGADRTLISCLTIGMTDSFDLFQTRMGCLEPSSLRCHSSWDNLMARSSWVSLNESESMAEECDGYSFSSDFWERIAPTPMSLVSTSITICQKGSRSMRIGAWDNLPLRAWKVVLASSMHLNILLDIRAVRGAASKMCLNELVVEVC